MKKYQFYNSNGRVVKQPQITDRTSAASQFYLAQCARAYRQYTPKLLFTMDETFWPLVPKQQQLVRTHNNKEFKPSTNIDVKAGMTLVVTVAADGTKLPLYFIGKGKTMRCTDKFGPDSEYYYHSESGWMTEDVMLQYLDEIIVPASNGQCCGLVLDSYSAHITDAVYKKAKENNIEIIVVPSCMTSVLSPLDVGVNGILKSSYSRDWRRQRLFGNSAAGDQDSSSTYSKTSWQDAVTMAKQAYKKVTSRHIRTAFGKAASLPPSKDDNMIVLVGVEEKAKIALQRLPTKSKKKTTKVLNMEYPERKSERLAIVIDETDETADDYAIAMSMCEDVYEPDTDDE